MLQGTNPESDNGDRVGAFRRLAQFLRAGLKGKLFRHGSGNDTGAVHPTLVYLLHRVEAVLRREVEEGCIPAIEPQLEEVRALICDEKLRYSAEPSDDEAIDQLWVALLRLGMFDELLYLIDRLNLPLRSEVKTFITYCKNHYEICRRRGQSYRAAAPDVDVFTLGCIVWGDEYVDNFLHYNLRSMLAPGNLPALRAQGRVVCSIVTDAASEQRMRRHPAFEALSALADVEFTIIPDELIAILAKGHLVRNFYVLYGMLDHCSIYFAQGAASHLFMIPVDSVVADGSLSNMANYRFDGYLCCGGGNIVAETETFLPALRHRFGDDGPIQISTEDLASMAVEHAHHYFRSQVIALENKDFGKHPRELFWPADGGVEVHSVFIHPLFTSATGLARYERKHFANIDYGMIPRFCSEPSQVKVIEDPRQAYVNNFTAAARLYETTGREFLIEDFIGCHNYTYPVQKGLFDQAQKLPCRLKGWTSYADIGKDVAEINVRFGVDGRRHHSAEATGGA